MLSECKLDKKDIRQFITFPILKLSGVIIVFTALSIVWFDVAQRDVTFVVGLTWLWVGLIHIFPLGVIAFFHFERSIDMAVLIDNSTGVFELRLKNSKLKLNTNDIDKIVKVVSPPMYGNRLDFIGYGHFFYWKIVFKTGLILPVSCMVVDEDQVFDAFTIELEKRIFPIPNHVSISIQSLDQLEKN